MIYGSLFSGIEGASVAWRPLGWTCAWVAEIDPFACALLAHRYPDVPNLGDVNRIDPDAVEPVDLVVFGSPCQSFSVAGKRLGLDDPRGNMALVGLRVVGKLRPRWVVWENVPGVLSSDEGRDFGAFLGLLGELGYGFAYTVCDAQHFGVPQRRRRVFVVGCLGDWRPAAAVLFEPESLRGDSPPSRQAGQGAARPVASCAPGGSGYRNDADTADNLIAFSASEETFMTLGSRREPAVAYGIRSDAARNGEALTPSADAEGRIRLRDPGFNVYAETAPTLDSAPHAVAVPMFAAGHGGSLGAGIGKDGDPAPSLDTTGSLAVAFDTTQITSPANRSQPQPGDPCHPLAATAHPPDIAGSTTTVVAFHENQRAETTLNDTAGSLKVGGGKPGQGYPAAMQGMSVRRLTPRECARLQGFPDDYLDIEYRGKPAADGPKYRALGNSFCVPVVAWIGQRIQLFEDAVCAQEAAE